MQFTSTISVSKKNLDCSQIANILSKHGILSSITSNITTIPHIENGCNITQSISNKTEIINIWNILKDKYNLTCAHLKINDKYDGCILDFIKKSECKPFNK